MTPTQKKAKEKAKELIDFFAPMVYPYLGSSMLTNDTNDNVIIENAKKAATQVCDQTLETLRTIKGTGKISKLKLWGLVKESVSQFDVSYFEKK